MDKAIRILLILFLLLPLGVSAGRQAPTSVTWLDKVDPWVLQTAADGETEFLIFLREQADLNPAVQLADKHAKGEYVFQTLSQLAARSQAPLLAELERAGLDYRPFWIANMVWVRGDLQAIQALASRAEVAYLYANPLVQGDLPDPNQSPAVVPSAMNTIEWNVLQINADDVWAAGFSGQNVVIGGQDTGYDWQHPALINQYRGWDGDFASHDYNWYDATSEASLTPVDPYGHGTHTMGTMVGDDGAGLQIGVAPQAEWIGCRNMDAAGWGSPATYAACYQWFVAPTRVDGTVPRIDLAPDVINNSWACLPVEGCTNTNPNVLLAVVQAVRAAGILTVHSSGNYGPTCGQIYPAAIYGESFTVGSTDRYDIIAGSSSRGPATWDGSSRLKPQVSAPGVGVLSSVPGGGYRLMSGTSMAAPHVAGLAALLISAEPDLGGQVGTIETIIEQSAVPRYTHETCGGDTPSSRPNHTYGWGRVDAWAAYQSLAPHNFNLAQSVTSEHVLPGGLLTYTLNLDHIHSSYSTYGIVLTNTLPAQTEFITATLPHSWEGSSLRWDFNQLAAGESISVTLTVRAALTATGTIDNLYSGVRSDQVSPTVMGTPLSTLVHRPGLAIAAGQDHWGHPGDQLIFMQVFTNTGNYTDSFDIQVNSGLDWISLESPVTTLALGPGENTGIGLTAAIPAEAAMGTGDTAVLTIISQSDPAVSAEAIAAVGVYYRFYIPLLNKP